jgi:Fanconi anemia group M protein
MLGQRYASHPLLYPNVIEERAYQTTIAQKAYGKNTLVILPTALGKTVISALVVSQMLYNYKNTRVLVMAPTRPLVLQHRSSFQSMLRLRADHFALLTGKTPADYRTSVWEGSARLIFATPEVVRNDLLQGRLNLKDFGLLVFDECHRSVKEYAFTEVASSYVEHCPYPLILGMTASPGSDLDRIAMVCKSLFIEQVEYRSDDDEDVKPYINLVTVESKKVSLPAQYLSPREALTGMFNEKIRLLRYKGLLKKESTFVTRRDLIELGSELRYNAELSMEEERGPLWAAVSLESQALTLLHMLELLDTQGAYTLKCFADRLEGDDGKKSHLAIRRDRAYAGVRQFLDSPHRAEHPKLEEARRIVSEQVKSNPDSRMLVFTQYRDTASHLVEELNKEKGVRAERFVGQASKLRDRGLSQDKQASLIEDLRKGYLNTLCSTSIGEEGLDIPEVDLVIFYEPIPSEIRYIQRRGRTGRKAPGRVVILATEGTNDMVYLYASERRTERMRSITSSLNQRLRPVARSIGRPNPEPMSEGQLRELEVIQPSVSLSTVKEDDYERAKRFARIVGRAEHDVYMRILQEGVEGFDEELLYSEMEDEGYSRAVVAAALQRLVKGRYFSPDSKDKVSLAVKSIPGARLMTIEVEKVLQGGAVVVIDDKWRARLDAANYSGPRELIRKGRRFKALCELYRSAGVLNLNVRQVVQAES